MDPKKKIYIYIVYRLVDPISLSYLQFQTKLNFATIPQIVPRGFKYIR